MKSRCCPNDGAERRRAGARAALLLLLLLPACGQAQVTVLVQGFAASADSWRSAGVVAELQAAGWYDAGRLGGRGPLLPPPGPALVTVELDTLAPLQQQLRQLAAALEPLRRAGRSLVLVGHSAGGLLARLYMVRHPDAPVAMLVTIASPHLGSDGAQLAQLAGRSPLGWFSDWLPGGGDPLRLLAQLAPERPGNFLYWLNRQPHPPAVYVGVIRRRSQAPDAGAWLVSQDSQDLRAVAALRGRARALVVDGGHGLDRADGRLLVKILLRMRQA